MSERADLAQRFERERPRLRQVAGHLLGSAADAEDAVQETWLRLERAEGVANLEGWLTTVVSRVSLDLLRARRRAAERSWLVGAWPVEPADPAPGPPDLVAEADRAAGALLLVLDTLTPAERIAVVLHDVFGYSFEEVATVLERSPQATRQLASRARRRVRTAGRPARPDLRRERQVVDAWLAAVRTGDLSALLDLLHEDAVLEADFGARRQTVDGASGIGEQALLSGRLAERAIPVLIDALPGVAAVFNGRVVSLMAFHITDGRIDGLEVLADPERLGPLSELLP